MLVFFFRARECSDELLRLLEGNVRVTRIARTTTRLKVALKTLAAQTLRKFSFSKVFPFEWCESKARCRVSRPLARVVFLTRKHRETTMRRRKVARCFCTSLSRVFVVFFVVFFVASSCSSSSSKSSIAKSDEKKNHRFSARRGGRDLLLRSEDSELDFQLVKTKEKKDEKKKLLPPLFSRAAARLHHRRDKEDKEDKEEGKKMYTAGTKHLEEKERAYVNAMEQFRTRAMDRDRLTEVGKEYEEEVEKFEKENDSSSSSSSSSGSNNDDGTDEKTSSSGLTVFFGVAGGESNCEFTMDKGRWIADRLKAKKLVIPTCDHLFHSDADVDLLDYMIPDTVNHCKKEESSNTFELASWNHNVNTHGLSTAERFFGTNDHNNNGENVEESTENESNPSHHQQLVAKIEDASQKGILCVQVGNGGCDWEGKQFTPKLEFDSVITQAQLNKEEIESKGYEYVYVAGVFDWHPQDDKVKEWPGLFKMCDPPQYQEKLFNEARDSIKKYNADHPIDPEKTLCAHWRQEDFVGKGDPYVYDPVQGAKIMSEKAEEHGNLKDVLILTNDPVADEDKQRLETLKSELLSHGLTPHTVHHDKLKHSHDVFVDKAACLLMKGFIGTRSSTFSQSIAEMHALRDKYI